MSGGRAKEAAGIVAVLSAMALVVLDAGLVNVALPTIGRALTAAPSDTILAVTSYQTALVMGLLPCAHLADRFGYRRLFITGLLLFSAASTACAFAATLPMLVAARIVQGLGGAAILALGIALLRFALGPLRLGRAIGWNALTVALCSAAGPMLGAAILAVAPWPFLFLAKLPIVAIALLAAPSLPEIARRGRALDTGGIVLHASAAALAAVGTATAMAHPLSAMLLGTTALAFAAGLIRRQRSHEAPLWPNDLLALHPLRIAVIASICCFAGQSAGLLALSFYLQQGLGQGPIGAGLVMTCWPLSVAVCSPFTSRLAERFGSPLLCVAGAALLGMGLLLSAIWPLGTSLGPLALGAGLGGLGFGLFQVPNNRTLFLTAPPERSAAAGGMQGTARLVGQTLGALLVGLLFTAAPAGLAPRIGFGLASLCAFAAALVSATEVSPGLRLWPRTADAR